MCPTSLPVGRNRKASLTIPTPMLHERRVLFTNQLVGLLLQLRAPDRPLGSGSLSCMLEKTEREEEVDLRLDLVGIVVSDMKASLDFYRRLGLDIPEDAENEPHVDATTPSGLRVAWGSAELIQQIDPDWTEPSGGHRIALAFLCSSPDEVDAKYDELASLGHGHKEPWDAFWGQRYASLKDPDGNQVDLFASL